MSAAFIKYDFYETFNNAVEYDNKRLAQMLIEDEVAKLIAFKKQDVVNLLRSKGIKIKRSTSNDKILKLVIKNQNNEEISRGIVKMVIENNAKNKQQAIDAAKDFNANGRYKQHSQPQLKIKDKEFEDKVYNSYLNANGNNVGDLLTQHNTNKMEIDKTNPEYKKAIVKNTIKTATITAGSIALLYGGWFIYNKLKGGGTSKDTEQPEMTPPVAPVQTTPPAEPVKTVNALELNENNYKPNA